MILDLRKTISSLATRIGRPICLMEVCGTHTEAIAKAGIRQIMPANIELVTGPGCPVCVTPQEDIDAVVEIALSGVPVYCYGDVLRVPGTKMSLEEAMARGAPVQVVYSVEEILAAEKTMPTVPVFFGIGFETTAPMTAAAIKKGLTVYSAHKFFPPAMQELVKDPEIEIDGFISPGHVATVIGLEPFRIIRKPQVVAGFEPEDVLQAITSLLAQIESRRVKVENQYTRLVKAGGNRIAIKLLREVFSPAKSNWRGLGNIPNSGMEIRDKYKKFDAKHKYRDLLKKVPMPREPKGCRCADVIKGKIKPSACRLFRRKCTIDNPVGACMVSGEGACRIAYEN